MLLVGGRGGGGLVILFNAVPTGIVCVCGRWGDQTQSLLEQATMLPRTNLNNHSVLQ